MKMSQKDKDKLNKLDEKLKEMQKTQNESVHNYNDDRTPTEGEIKSSRAGSEFLASVFAGGFIGYGIDHYFNALPWGMIFFLLMGFVAGVYRANSTMVEDNKKD